MENNSPIFFDLFFSSQEIDENKKTRSTHVEYWPQGIKCRMTCTKIIVSSGPLSFQLYRSRRCDSIPGSHRMREGKRESRNGEKGENSETTTEIAFSTISCGPRQSTSDPESVSKAMLSEKCESKKNKH